MSNHESDLFISEQHPISRRWATVEDHGTSAFLYLSEPDHKRPIGDCWLYNRTPDLVRRVEFRCTPKHGSWLNISENEVSSLTRQCFANRRFATVQLLGKQTSAWSDRSNSKQRTVDWQFTIDDARHKLKELYPNFKD